MATAMGTIEERDVVKCDACGLIQFVTAARSCRRCRTPYEEAPVCAESKDSYIPAPLYAPEFDYGYAVWLLRSARGYSQSELASRAGTVRTYISKVENSRVQMSLPIFQKMAKALDVDPRILVELAGVPRRVLRAVHNSQVASSPALVVPANHSYTEASL